MGGDMSGFCPAGTGVPDCYAGPKWTPNDPMFFLHHAVSTPSSSPVISAVKQPLLQMIDRLWTEWQHKAQQNGLSFGGGSVQARETFEMYQTFPNGGPPFLHVGATRPNASCRYLSPVMQFGSVLPSDGLWGNVTVFDVMDTKSEVLCYTYQ